MRNRVTVAELPGHHVLTSAGAYSIGLAVAKDPVSGTLAVILHADVADSTTLVQQDKEIAHERIQDSFRRFGVTITDYHGKVLELRGDALLARFDRASDAVTAALAFQTEQDSYLAQLEDDLRPALRVGISMGEVVFADNTVTGAGVVQAQRIEQLANPGSVCITSAIQEALSKRMPIELDDLGEQALKGFDSHVHVYRVGLTPGASIPPPDKHSQPDKTSNKKGLLAALAVLFLVLVGSATYWFSSRNQPVETASIERMAYPLPDKPSIAVLPFTNMSSEAEQEFFADGMTEDLITDISKLSGLFVIARNSVFAYKGKVVNIGQVAEELGVRYVMEGSVRRIGNQVRINAQLIDATTGGHVWAERYDGSLDDVFSMQDRITRSIVTALALTLSVQEKSSIERTETVDAKTYDLYLRGWEHYRVGTAKDYASAIIFFEKALSRDPDFERAHAALAAVYWNILRKGWWQESLGIQYYPASELARIALRRSQQNPTALTHQVASEWIVFYSSNRRRALAEARLALELDPNHPAGHLAMANALLKDNQPRQAVEFIESAMRLDPYHPTSYLVMYAQAQFQLGNYAIAAEWLERSIEINSEDDWAFVYLAATYGQLNLAEKARAALNRANELRANADWGRITLMVTAHPVFRWQGNRDALKEGLLVAGAPRGGEWYKLIVGDGESAEVTGASNIDARKAKLLHDGGALFIDIAETWFVRRIPGARFMQWWSSEGWLFNEVALGKLADKHEEIVIYSTWDGRQVLLAGALAASWGFTKISIFPGGIDEWVASGYPVDTEKI